MDFLMCSGCSVLRGWQYMGWVTSSNFSLSHTVNFVSKKWSISISKTYFKYKSLECCTSLFFFFCLYSTWCCALDTWHPSGPHCFWLCVGVLLLVRGNTASRHELQKHHSWDSLMPGWALGYGRPDSTTHAKKLTNLLTLDKTSNDMGLLAHIKDACTLCWSAW